MLAIEIEFLTGRYHATPWGYQVNEGVAEWPPSPWRLLRALTSIWLRRAETGENQKTFEELIGALAEPPRYLLPRARQAHTRHYMPWEFTKKKQDLTGKKVPTPVTTQVLDTFVVTEPGEVLVAIWPEVELDSSTASLLDQLLPGLTYLGRAESWCRARRADDANFMNGREIDAAPSMESEGGEDGLDDLVELLSARAGTSSDELMAGMLLDTSHMRATQKRFIPAAAAWQRYRRRADALQGQVRKRQSYSVTRQVAGPWIARYALTAPALPPERFTIQVAEDFRRALMSRAEGCSEVFAGRREGAPRLDGHRHALFLPEAADPARPGRLTHLTVFAREGFGDEEQRTIQGLRFVTRHGRGSDFQVLLEHLGPCDPDEFAALAPPFGKAQGRKLGAPVGPATRWISATPFCPTRHPKPSRDFDQQVRNWLKDVGIAVEPSLVRIVSNGPRDEGYPRRENRQHSPGGTPWREFRRLRKGAADPIQARGIPRFLEVELTFPEPVLGPIAIGHLCHFGLGRFVPDL